MQVRQVQCKKSQMEQMEDLSTITTDKADLNNLGRKSSVCRPKYWSTNIWKRIRRWIAVLIFLINISRKILYLLVKDKRNFNCLMLELKVMKV